MQSLQENIFYTFGTKSFITLLVKNLSFIFFVIIIIGVLLVTKDMSFFQSLDELLGTSSWDWMMKIVLIGGSMMILFQIINSWITYQTTCFMVSENTLTLRHGFFTKYEKSFPLRYVINMSHHQGVLDQLMGTGTAIIEMSSDEPESLQSPHANDLTFHDIDITLLASLQSMVLTRANTQKMSITQNSSHATIPSIPTE